MSSSSLSDGLLAIGWQSQTGYCLVPNLALNEVDQHHKRQGFLH